MEYLEGLDMDRMVKTKGPLPVAHATYFASQAAQGMQHAYDQGIVHRDIEPGNLMLTRKGSRAVIKVIDFGLAKSTREAPVDGGLTDPGQALGTPEFMAPEQFRDAQAADIRADIYSLGCTLLLPSQRKPSLSRGQPVGAVPGAPRNGRGAAELGSSGRAGRAGVRGGEDDGQGAGQTGSDAVRSGSGAGAVLQVAMIVPLSAKFAAG